MDLHDRAGYRRMKQGNAWQIDMWSLWETLSPATSI